MPYKKGKILRLPENPFDAKYGIVIGIREERGQQKYKIAIYQGKGLFVDTICEFSETGLEVLTKKEAERLIEEFKKYNGPRRCENTLICEHQL